MGCSVSRAYNTWSRSFLTSVNLVTYAGLTNFRKRTGRAFRIFFHLDLQIDKKNQADHSPLSNPGTRVKGQFGADSQTDLACEAQKRIRSEGSDDWKYVCASQAKTDLTTV